MSLVAFGNTSDGQLGLGGCEIEQIVSPTSVRIPFVTVHDIACSPSHCLVLSSEGEVASTGNNDAFQLGRDGPAKKFGIITHLSGLGIKQVACGMNHSLAITETDHVLAWGANDYGQLGLGKIDEKCVSTPLEINITEVVQIACGAYHCMALKNDGDLLTWGQNSTGQLGLGHHEDVKQPTQVKSLAGIPLAQLAAGSNHSMVLSTSAALFAWGMNNYGQLGCGDAIDRAHPVAVKSLRHQRVVFLACGDAHTAALTYDGRLFTFGCDSYGQLGHGLTADRTPGQLLPRQVLELMGTKVVTVATGRCHTVAVTSGKMYAFGLGSSGQLGLGDRNSRLLPTLLKNDNPFNAVFAGGDCTYGIQENFDDTRNPGPYRQLGNIECLSLDKVKNDVKEYSLNGDKTIMDLLENVFSSGACICNSFLIGAPAQFGCGKDNMGVNVDEACETNDVLSNSSGAKQIDAAILRCLEWSLIPSLTPSPPHLECLRLYILLPVFNVFADVTNCFKLHTPFAHNLWQLNSIAKKVIFDWICALERRHMRRFIYNFKSVISHIIKMPWDTKASEIAERETCLRACLRYLSMLNEINCKCHKVNYDMFYIHELAECIDVRQAFLRFITRRDPNVFSFCDYSFIFDANVKTMFLQTDAQIQMQLQLNEVNQWNIQSLFLPIQQQSPFLSLTISRDNIVHDTIQQLMNMSSLDLKKPMKVQFAGEEADDAGGVKKEFFLLLFRQLLSPDYGMFVEFEESRRLWLSPNPFEEASMYQLVGVLFGLAIYNSVLVDVNFPLALYKKLLKKDVTLEDFTELSPIEGRSLEQVLDYEGDDFEEIFCLTFAIQERCFGETRTAEFKPNGKEICVTKESREEYVRLYVQHKLSDGVRSQFDAFADGFHRAVNSQILHLFQAQELMEMTVGNEHYDWETFQKNAEYKGDFWPGHTTILTFWKAFRELDESQKRKFLLFLTGSDRVPLLGMKTIPICIQPANDTDRYPVAHTCFNLLDLPKIEDNAEMSRRLQLAIEHTEGFTLV